MSLTGSAVAIPIADSLRNDIATFLKFGTHRAGTQGEGSTLRWLRERIWQSSYGIRTVEFPITTLLNPSGSIHSGSFKLPAFPQWNPPKGSLADPIKAPLAGVIAEASGNILLIPQPFPTGAYWVANQQSIAEDAKAAGARALVIAVDDPTDGIYALNQESTREMPLPVATVRRSGLAQLHRLANSRPNASLTLTGQYADAKAHYLIAKRLGTGRAIVISTPLTGWFSCGAERGPGVALMLSLADSLTHVTRPIFLVATGAHELGHLGMKHALASGDLPAPADTELWLHLGAGICATAADARYGVKSAQYLTLSPTMADVVGSAFSPDWTRLPANPKAPGEAGDVIAAGYQRVIGLAGSFPGFHTPEDNGSAVDYARLTGVRSSLIQLVGRIAVAQPTLEKT